MLPNNSEDSSIRWNFMIKLTLTIDEKIAQPVGYLLSYRQSGFYLCHLLQSLEHQQEWCLNARPGEVLSTAGMTQKKQTKPKKISLTRKIMHNVVNSPKTYTGQIILCELLTYLYPFTVNAFLNIPRVFDKEETYI